MLQFPQHSNVGGNANRYDRIAAIAAVVAATRRDGSIRPQDQRELHIHDAALTALEHELERP